MKSNCQNQYGYTVKHTLFNHKQNQKAYLGSEIKISKIIDIITSTSSIKSTPSHSLHNSTTANHQIDKENRCPSNQINHTIMNFQLNPQQNQLSINMEINSHPQTETKSINELKKKKKLKNQSPPAKKDENLPQAKK